MLVIFCIAGVSTLIGSSDISDSTYTKQMPSGIVEVTVNAAAGGGGGEGDAAVEAQRVSPRRRSRDQRRPCPEMPFEVDNSVGTTNTETNGGQGSSSGPDDHQLHINNNSAAAHSKGKGNQSTTIIHSYRSRSEGEQSSMSLSANSLLDKADDDDDEDEESDDDDLGPVTRKAFDTCPEYTQNHLEANGITPSESGGLASVAEKRASILRGCGACCTSNGLDKPTVSPADNLKSLARRGVCFSDNLVTDTHEVPRTKSAELNEHFYTTNDSRRFKRQARDEGHCEQQLLRMLRDFCSDLQDQEGDWA